MIKRIWAKLTGGRCVWLFDMDGQVTLSIAYKDPWGNLYAERHWPFSIRRIQLGDDGRTINGSYVKLWKYAE